MNLVRSMNDLSNCFENAVCYCTGNTLSFDAIHVSAKAYEALGILSDCFSGSSVRNISFSLSQSQEFIACTRLPRYVLAMSDVSISSAFSSFSSLTDAISVVSKTVVAGALAINGFKRIFSAAPVLSMTMQHSSVYSLALLAVQIDGILDCIKRIRTLNGMAGVSLHKDLFNTRSSYIELIEFTGGAIFGMAHFLQASSETVRLAWAVSSLCSFGKLVDAGFSRGSLGGRNFYRFSAYSV